METKRFDQGKGNSIQPNGKSWYYHHAHSVVVVKLLSLYMLRFDANASKARKQCHGSLCRHPRSCIPARERFMSGLCGVNNAHVSRKGTFVAVPIPISMSLYFSPSS
eukprot:scaffold656_cov403-Pavlova_lutheri.AAC.39